MSCSSDDQSDKECPLCMEALEVDDIDFYPCKCEYQICRFCWHRLKNDENGLCPACRQPYPEDPVNFKPLSSADLQRIKDEKKMKLQAEKMRISESRKHLASYRVLQKNLVYVVGLSTKFANEEVLRKLEHFGKFGKILKIVLGTSPILNLPAHLQPSHTAYITYNKVEEALRAIQGVNNTILDGRMIKASLGTTKYCSSFLRSQTCGKPECMYLHDIADNDISFTKEDMHAGKHSDYERRLIDAMIARRQAMERRQMAMANSKYDQNGTDYGEDGLLDEAETANGMGDLVPERQDSQEKENILMEETTKRQKNKYSSTSPPPRRTSPPADIDHDSSYSSMNADILDHHHLEADLSKDILMGAPPGLLPTPPGLAHSSSTHSLTESTSKLLRLMNLSEGSGRGSVPAPAPQEEAPAPLMNWQTLLGLSPPQEPMKFAPTSRLASPPLGLNPLFDDDLGFDPFNESTKGLAALLEEEERVDRHRPSSHSLLQQQHQLYNQSLHRPLSDLWASPSLEVGTAQTSSVQPSRSHSTAFSAAAPFDMFGLTSTASHLPTYSHSYHNQQPHNLSNSTQYNDYGTPSAHHHQQQQHFHQQRQMNNFAPPPGLSAPQARQVPTSIEEWQQGLKALLPNVNVRFASDLSEHQAHHQRWNGLGPLSSAASSQLGGGGQPNSVGNTSSSSSYMHHPMMNGHGGHHHMIPPPPGFTSISNR